MKKKIFRVWATYRSDCYLDVEAKDENEAYDIAKNSDGEDFINDDYGINDWEIKEDDIEELETT